MDDVKKTYREGEQQVKEAWRQSDGNEDLKDKVGNAGDEVRKDLGNAGDDLKHAGDDMLEGHDGQKPESTRPPTTIRTV